MIFAQQRTLPGTFILKFFHMHMLRLRQSLKRSELSFFVPKLVRYQSNSSRNENDETLQNELLTALSNQQIKGNFKIFQKSIHSKSPEEISKISSKVLSCISKFSSSDQLIIAALQSVTAEHLNQDIINKFTKQLPELSQGNRSGHPFQYALTNFTLRALEKDPSILKQFESSLDLDLHQQQKSTSSLLISMYLHQGQILKAYEYIIKTLSEGGKLNSSSMELLIIHLCHREAIDKADNLVDLSEKHQLVLFPRTLGIFLSKAIELGDVNICLKHYLTIINKTYMDNGSLINLLELLNDHHTLVHAKKIYEIILRNDNVSLDHLARYRRCQVEILARRRGFKRAFEALQKHTPSILRVRDYPQLLNTVTISSQSRKLESRLVQKMSSKLPVKLKRFYLSLILAKCYEKGNIEFGIELVKEHKLIRDHITEESLLYITRGLIEKPDIFIIDSVAKAIIETPHLQLKNHFLIDNLLKLIIESQYWYNVFKVYEKITAINYKIDPKLYSLLALKSQRNSFGEHLKKIPQ